MFQRYARHTQALIARLAEWYLQGVSTRKVRHEIETLYVYALAEPEARRGRRTTNAHKREHEEIRRRTRVIRILPNAPSPPAP